MLVDYGVIDRLVSTAFGGISSSVAIYVPRGRAQPNDADNPSGVPWFFHKMRVTGGAKVISASEPDKARITVTIAAFAPESSIDANAYALGTAMTTAAGLIAFQRLADSGPQTHEVFFDGYEMDIDFTVDSAEAGSASLITAGIATITGFACRIA